MNGQEKSHPGIVAVKPTKKPGDGWRNGRSRGRRPRGTRASTSRTGKLASLAKPTNVAASSDHAGCRAIDRVAVEAFARRRKTSNQGATLQPGSPRAATVCVRRQGVVAARCASRFLTFEMECGLLLGLHTRHPHAPAAPFVPDTRALPAQNQRRRRSALSRSPSLHPPSNNELKLQMTSCGEALLRKQQTISFFTNFQ